MAYEEQWQYWMTGLKVNPALFFCIKFKPWSEYPSNHCLVFCEKSVWWGFSPHPGTKGTDIWINYWAPEQQPHSHFLPLVKVKRLCYFYCCANKSYCWFQLSHCYKMVVITKRKIAQIGSRRSHIVPAKSAHGGAGACEWVTSGCCGEQMLKVGAGQWDL